MQVIWNKKNNILLISQILYTNKLLKKFNIKNNKPIYSLTIQVMKLKKSIEQASANNINIYQQHISSLICMCNPNKEHFYALNRIWQYLKITKNKELLFK